MSSIGALASAYTNFTLLKNLTNDIKIYYQYLVAATITLLIGKILLIKVYFILYSVLKLEINITLQIQKNEHLKK